MATIEQLGAALIKADAAGNSADAKALANAIQQMRGPTRGAAPEEPSPQFANPLMALAGAYLKPAIKAAPSSAGGLLRGIGQAITSPIETASGLLDVAAGGLQNVLPKPVVDFVNSFSSDPQNAQRAVAAANQFGGVMKDRLGSLQAMERTFMTDPVGFAADISTLFGLGGGTLKAGAQLGERAGVVVPGLRAAGEGAAALGRVTNPLAPVAAAIEKVGPVLGKGASSLMAVVSPEKLKYKGLAAALDNNPVLMGEVMDLLKQGKTIQEAAAITGTPGLAAFTKTASNASTETQRMYNALDAERRAVQANQLAGAEASANALTQQALPVATAGLSAPRKAVSQTLAGERAALQGQEATQTAALTAQAEAAAAKLAEQQAARTGALTAEQQAAEAGLAQQRANLHKTLPDIDPSESGATLGQTKERLLKETQTQVTGPAYAKAFELAPEPFNIQSVVDRAKALGQDLLSVLAPNTVPSELSRIQRLFQPPAPPTPALGGGKVSSGIKAPTPETPPAMATLEDAATVNRALSAAYGKLASALPSDTAATALRNNINTIRGELNAAIARGAPAEAVDAYNAAKQLHTTEVVQPFYTGKLSTTDRANRLGQPQLSAEQIVPTGISSIQEAKAYVRTFARDPAAMEVLKNGILDQVRRDVSKVTGAGVEVSADKARQWLAKNKEIVDVYDNAGMGLRSEVDRIASQAQGLKIAAEGVKEATKAIPDKVKAEFTPAAEALAAQEANIKPSVIAQFAEENKALQLASDTLNFKYVKDLRQKVVADPMTADMALRRMDAPAKSALARGVMQDAAALKEGAKILDHLTTNEAGIMRVLNASEPATAAKTFAAMKDAAETLQLVQETSRKLPANAMAAAKNLDNLTQGMPEVRAVVANIQAQLAAGAKFEELATQGGKAGTTAARLFKAEVTPHIFPLNKVMSIVNAILGRLEGRIDKKLAVQIANELSTSSGAAEALAKAQATRANIGATSNKLGAALRSPIAPAAVSVTNALAPRIVIGGIGRDDTRKSNALAPAR
jgi:hypothetical protein